VSVLAADHAFTSYARSTDVQYNHDPSVGVANGLRTAGSIRPGPAPSLSRLWC